MSEENETFLVHIPDSGNEPLSREEIRVRIKDGKFSDSILIWNEQEQDWKPANTFPWLKKTTVLPTAAVIEEIRNRSVTQSKAIANAISQEKAAREADAPDKPKPKTQSFVARPAARQSLPDGFVRNSDEISKQDKPIESKSISKEKEKPKLKSENELHSIKAQIHHAKKIRIPVWVYPILVATPVLLLLLIDWFSISRQINSVFTKFNLHKSIKPSAHYQFHLNPNVLVIDLDEVNPATTPETFIDILTVLAKVKDESWTGSLFNFIQLRKSGVTKFMIKGVTWKELASLYDEPSGVRASFLMKNILDQQGKPVFAEDADEFKKELALTTQAYSAFCNTFWKTTVTEKFFGESAIP